MSKILDSLKDNKNKLADGFSMHVILYAKGWYGNSGNILLDIAKLLMVWSHSPEPSIRDAKEILCRTYAEYGSKNHFDLFEGIYEITGWKWEGFSIPQRKPEEVMIGKLSCLDGYLVDPKQKLDIHFGK
jgi:hypothetical protein